VSTNRFGLDVSYFRKTIDRELCRDLSNFRPDELARVCARLARTADKDVLKEPEFNELAEELSRTKAELEEAKRLLNDMAMGAHMAKVQGNVDYIPNPDEAIEFLSNQQSEE
jgi:hypothetical protein